MEKLNRELQYKLNDMNDNNMEEIDVLRRQLEETKREKEGLKEEIFRYERFMGQVMVDMASLP